jgi:hypothetical protein
MFQGQRLFCYRCYDSRDYDRLAGICEQLGGFWTSMPIWIEYYVPEERSVWFVLHSGSLEREARLDYYR